MLKAVKSLVLNSSHSMGYDIVPLREVKERDFAIHLRDLFTFLKIDCVFDVGANIGQYHDFLRDKVRFTGSIVSFEPIARNVHILEERRRSDPDWLIEGSALGRESGVMTLNVMKSDQFSSFLEPDNSRVPAFDGLNATSHTESVNMATLDQVFAAVQNRLDFKRLYLKLDTQGYDIEVLRGGEIALRSVFALQTEASVIGIYEGMPSYMDTIRFLNERGFDITGLYPISRDAMLRLIEFDCVMINSALAPRPA